MAKRNLRSDTRKEFFKEAGVDPKTLEDHKFEALSFKKPKHLKFLQQAFGCKECFVLLENGKH